YRARRAGRVPRCRRPNPLPSRARMPARIPWERADAAAEQVRSAAAARPRRPQRRRRNFRCDTPSCSRGASVSLCLPFGELLKKLRVVRADGTVDTQTGVGPAADPIAVVQIGVAGVSVVDKRFVMAAAGAQWARPTGMAIVLTADVAAAQKIGL